jgi:hypothetical protein
VVDKSLRPEDAGSVRSTILNAVAYAREALRLLEPKEVLPTDPEALARRWQQVASSAGLAEPTVLSYFARPATPAEQERFRVESLQGAKGLPSSKELSTTGERIVEAKEQWSACVSAGNAPEACCRALSLPWAMVGNWSGLSEPERTKLQTEAAAGSGYAALVDGALAVEKAALAAGTKTELQPFSHQGIKAWLAVCEPVLTRAPATLADLVLRYGDYANDPAWEQEIHPISMAKLAPRRIYRHRAKGVSVAESLGTDCGLRETEVIVVQGSGLAFWSYGATGTLQYHGFFPASRGVDAVKFTPDACLGCHYRLDTRAFDVRYPSYIALGLKLRGAGGEDVWSDGSACIRPGERVIWHERP